MAAYAFADGDAVIRSTDSADAVAEKTPTSRARAPWVRWNRAGTELLRELPSAAAAAWTDGVSPAAVRSAPAERHTHEKPHRHEGSGAGALSPRADRQYLLVML
jgi:hypothetical protein